MPEDADSWAPSEAKDWKDGRHSNQNEYVHDHAGEVDRAAVREMLTSVRQAFSRAQERGWIDADRSEDLPRRVEDLDRYRHLLEHARTERFGRATHEGDTGGLRAMVGSESRRPDLSGLRTLETLQDLVSAAAFIAYMWAEPGSGKTNFGCLIGEVWKQQHPQGEVATNIRTLEQADRWIPSYPQLQEWLKSDADEWTDGEGGSGTRKLFIFDEASSHASGRGSDGYETAQKLGPLLYKIRKFGGSLIIIGHDGKDVHPAVRALGKAIHKEDLKRATVYESIENREGSDKIESFEGIPETSWNYDDKEATNWTWGFTDEQEEEVEEEAMALAEQYADEMTEERVEEELVEIATEAKREGHSYRDIAEWHPWGRTKLSDRVEV